MIRLQLVSLVAASFLLAAANARAGEWSGYAGFELRAFGERRLDPAQHSGAAGSIVFQPEYHHRWDNGRQSFVFTPYLRVDQHDSERTHGDIRELAWVKAAQSWELRLGVRKVFWGVAESVHLVDIINQTDLIENIDGEDKLGQPMANFAWISEWGTVDFFVLPGFRERSFPGPDGRLRTIPFVDVDRSRFESSRERRHVDWALRWSRSLSDWDIGLAHFDGTGREPRLLPGVNTNGETVLVPFYDQIQQTSLDLQATLGQWLWKLETLHRNGHGKSYNAAVGGFEYTFVGVFGSRVDLGLLTEYLYDDRGGGASTPFQDDVFIGARIALNDADSTEILFGIIDDRDTSARFYNLEFSRRLGASWKIELEARAFSDIPAGDPLFAFRRDDYLELQLRKYF